MSFDAAGTGTPNVAEEENQHRYTYLLSGDRYNICTPACSCGWQNEDPKHGIMFCPDRAHHCHRLYEAARPTDMKKLCQPEKGSAVTKWAMSEGLRNRFSLAKEQSDWVEGKGRKNKVESEEIEEQRTIGLCQHVGILHA